MFGLSWRELNNLFLLSNVISVFIDVIGKEKEYQKSLKEKQKEDGALTSFQSESENVTDPLGFQNEKVETEIHPKNDTSVDEENPWEARETIYIINPQPVPEALPNKQISTSHLIFFIIGFFMGFFSCYFFFKTKDQEKEEEDEDEEEEVKPRRQ